MKIKNKTIYFKSSEPFFTKEMTGIKNNTVRTLDVFESIELKIHIDELECICIESVSKSSLFVRKITDISYYSDRWIFTWSHS